MGRPVVSRRDRWRAAATSLLVGGTVAALLVPLTGSATAADAGEAVIAATLRDKPRDDQLSMAGDTGFLHYEEGPGPLWTRYADGVSTPVGSGIVDTSRYGANGAWGDVITYPRTSGGTTVYFRDMRDGTERTLAVPAGHRYSGSYGDTVLTGTYTGGSITGWHLFDLVDGAVRHRPVTGIPTGATLPLAPAAANGQGLLTGYGVSGATKTGWVDLETAQLTPLPDAYRAGGAQGALIGDRYTVWFPDGQVVIFKTPDFEHPVAQYTVPYEQYAWLLGTMGDHFVVARFDPADAGSTGAKELRVHQIVAVPLAGGAEKVLLSDASAKIRVGLDGSMVAVAGATPQTGAVHRITVTDGVPSARKVIDLPAVRSETGTVHLAGGRLDTLDWTLGESLTLNSRTISATTPLTYSAPSERADHPDLTWSDCYIDFPCPTVHGSGDGRLVADDGGPDGTFIIPKSGAAVPLNTTLTVSHWATEASGRFASVTGFDSEDGTRRDQIIDLDRNTARLTAASTVSGLWGRTRWTPGTTTGTVVPKDIVTGLNGAAVNLGSGCKPASLKAAADWLYWSCGPTKSGVHNIETGRNVTLPAAATALGDGFVAIQSGADVTVYDIRSGTPVKVSAFSTKEYGNYGQEWSVDPYTGQIAWVDSADAVHVRKLSVTNSDLEQIDYEVPAAVSVAGGAVPWQPKWWLSRPSSAWTLTLKAKTGATVRTLTGASDGIAVRASWDGKTSTGALVPNGAYTWTLTARPADGQGVALVRSGTVKVSGAAAVRRDHLASDGVGDMLTLNSKGYFTFHQGTGAGAFSTKVSASGWSTSVKAVPFGDVNGDRCNDVLVRVGDALRVYKPGCGKALTTTTPYTSLGTGWSAYNVLTSPGDLTGDGRSDLIARRSSTGDIYLFAATSDGKLAAGKKIRSAWSSYTHIVGAGDLNGDGHGDVLVRRTDGTLFRYDGIGNGLLKERVTVFTGWGASYTAIVGAGDITGDGKADIVVRDKNGVLYRNNGDGKGGLSGRTQIATGWTYTGVF